MKHFLLLLSLAYAAIQLGAPSRADGHGFAGARFFPATLATEDPFIADELSLPTISTIRTPEDGGTRETEFSADIAKRITPNFGLEIGEALAVLNPDEGKTVNGFGNLELGGKYQILENDPHETIVSLGLLVRPEHIFQLVTPDLSQSKIMTLGNIPSANRCGRIHGKAFRQFDADVLLHIQQFK